MKCFSSITAENSSCVGADGVIDTLDCFCRDTASQTVFASCLDATCPTIKSTTSAFIKASCSAGADKSEEAISCVFDKCNAQLAEPIKTACGADADVKGECACTSAPVKVSLDACLSKTCGDLVDLARITRDTFCSLGGTEISFEGSFDLNATVTGSLSSGPTQTGTLPGGNGGEGSASTLSRGGIAAVLAFAAGVVAIAI
ncbi:hypothetical protein AURDEDRAFT_175326 [Auricularia subglabra TFB-10046 SS5]|nr:hypothetical protein AURDEDRAFT_175326 [Auricularia subglabra TFB-10046 SS5]